MLPRRGTARRRRRSSWRAGIRPLYFWARYRWAPGPPKMGTSRLDATPPPPARRRLAPACWPAARASARWRGVSARGKARCCGPQSYRMRAAAAAARAPPAGWLLLARGRGHPPTWETHRHGRVSPGHAAYRAGRMARSWLRSGPLRRCPFPRRAAPRSGTLGAHRMRRNRGEWVPVNLSAETPSWSFPLLPALRYAAR